MYSLISIFSTVIYHGTGYPVFLAYRGSSGVVQMGANDDDAGCGLERKCITSQRCQSSRITIKHKQKNSKIMTESKELIIFHLYVFSSTCSTTVVVYIRLNGLGLRALLFRAANGLSFARSFCAPTLVER